MSLFRVFLALVFSAFAIYGGYKGFANWESDPVLAGLDFFLCGLWTYIAALKLSRKANE